MHDTDVAHESATNLADTIVVGNGGSDDADSDYDYALCLAERMGSACALVLVVSKPRKGGDESWATTTGGV